MKQDNLFSGNTIHTLIVNSNQVQESRSEPVAMKATATEKEFLQKLAYAKGITTAELIREACKFYVEFYEHQDKLRKYRKPIASLLKELD